MIEGVFTSFKSSLSPKHCLLLSMFLLSLMIQSSSFARNPSKPNLASSDEVQFVLPGGFVYPFDYLNSISFGGMDIDNDDNLDVVPPCTCRNTAPIPNGVQSNAGLFSDQIIVATGISGQTWYLETVYNALNPSDLSAIPVGTQIPEVGNTGIYVLPILHQDAVGYLASVHAPIDYPGEVFGPILNTCYYPDPLIEAIGDAYCIDDPDILLNGYATSPFDDNFLPLSLEAQLWLTSRDDGAVFFGQTFSPSEFGAGNYTIRYTADAGDNAHFAANKTGCAITVEQEVAVRGTTSLACNAGVNVALNPVSCEATISAEVLLAGNFDDYELFEVEIVDPQGNSLGNTIPADFANLTLPASVTDLCSEVKCFTTVNYL